MTSVGEMHEQRAKRVAMTPHSTSSGYASFGLLVAAIVTYAYWLTDGTFHLAGPPARAYVDTRVFNSMLEHMVHGRFDVDPAMAGSEGFVRDGRVYVDWGPVPALVRLPLL